MAEQQPLSIPRLIDWIHGARTFSEKKGLSNMRRMLDLLGRPDRAFASVHVAGTNGKGSVCAMIERALRECGHRTGLYTSPYLRRYQERIRICGRELPDDLFAEQGNRLHRTWMALNEEGVFPTAFELGTALAFLCFQAAGVDVAVIEVGLGGRLDPTNVIDPCVCAIASIGLDHEEVLGSTLPEIAREKAGILKPGVPVALYPQEPEVRDVILSVAGDVGAPALDLGALPLTVLHRDARGASFEADMPGFGRVCCQVHLAGEHQVRNAQLALAALALLRTRGFDLDPDLALRGIALAQWPGRLSWQGENLLLDGAHNEQGARVLAAYVRTYLAGHRIVLLTAMMRDKRPADCAKVLAGIADQVVTTQVAWPRALPAGELAALYQAQGKSALAVDDERAALAQAQAQTGPDDVLLVCGSLYLVGDVLNLLG